jgi:type IV pilus assembly protein PilA
MKKERISNNKGFSLVELIIVIAIMAVLVGVLAPQFIKYVENSRQSTDVQNIDQVATTLRTYYADDENGGTYSVSLYHNKAASGSGLAALTDGGIATTKLKSSKWDSDEVVITVDVTNGTTTKSGQATRYKADGTKLP